MSKERIKISEDLYDIMPSDYQDLVKSATYGKEDRGWKDIGNSPKNSSSSTRSAPAARSPWPSGISWPPCQTRKTP